MAPGVRTVSFFLVSIIAVASGEGVSPNTNMYNNLTPAQNGVSRGQHCVHFSSYMPTCGWELVVSISYPVTRVDEWTTTQNKIDDYTYRLVPNFGYEDLSVRSPTCFNIDVHGTFGNTQPEISVTYSCVCDASTDGCEAVEYTLLPRWDATTTPLADGAPDEPLTSEDLVTPEDLSYPNAGHSNMKLVHVIGACYTGTDKKKLSAQISHLSECASFCLMDTTCRGVNFSIDQEGCFLVSAVIGDDKAGLEKSPGCQFWNVVWRST